MLSLMGHRCVLPCLRVMKRVKFFNRWMRQRLDGIAQASFTIDQPGKVEIRVVSEPAVVSDVLQFDATSEGVAVTVVVPEVTTGNTEIDPPTPTVVVENDLISPDGYPRIGVWLLVLLALFGSALLMFWAVSRIVSPALGFTLGAMCFSGGLLAYNYLALGFPGAAEWIGSNPAARSVFCYLHWQEKLWDYCNVGLDAAGSVDKSRKQAEEE